MSRPRIRTLKPEMWQDEKVGTLSREARLLLVGLITMADDEGRLRAMPALIIGHAFPYDDDAPRKVGGWLDEIECTGLIARYQYDGKPYIALRNWRRHQKINRAQASKLPPPPDHAIVTDNSVSDHEQPTDASDRRHGMDAEDARPPARACAGADRIKDQDRERSTTTSSPADAVDPEIGGLCHLLGRLIQERDPKASVEPDGQRWVTDMRLLIERDGRSHQEVRQVIEWAQADSFWASNILSPAKLRKQFTALLLRMHAPARPATGGGARSTVDADIAWLEGQAQALEAWEGSGREGPIPSGVFAELAASSDVVEGTAETVE